MDSFLHVNPYVNKVTFKICDPNPSTDRPNPLLFFLNTDVILSQKSDVNVLLKSQEYEEEPRVEYSY